MRKSAVVVFLILTCLCLSGCVTKALPHSESEVLDYLESRYPGNEFIISKIDETTWSCSFADMPDVVFTVESEWKSADAIPTVGYQLSDNKSDVFWDYYVGQYASEGGDLSLWHEDRNNFVTEFSTMSDARDSADQLYSFYAWLSDKPHTEIQKSGYYKYVGVDIPLWYLNDVAYVQFGRSYDEAIEECENLVKSCYSFYWMPYDEFSLDELESYARDNWTFEYMFRDVEVDGSPMQVSDFDGIGIECSCVSYAGFYDVLQRIGISVDGTRDSYSFVGLDGNTYEFSYEFCNEKCWYFLRNGEIVTGYTDEAPVVFLKSDFVLESTGAKFT